MTRYPDFPTAFEYLRRQLRVAPVVRTERWQGVAANQATRELLNVNFEVDLCGDADLGRWRKEIQPNLPWADDHFEERVGGEPINPGVQWANWPWARSAAGFKTQRFNHNYMERLWPKFARRTEDGKLPMGFDGWRKYPEKDKRPRMGIAWEYGDLQDLVELLAAEPHTRQAWIPLFFPEDTGRGDGGRKPCTLGYQVIVRDGQAHIWYPLRSCDFLRHFPDDVYLAVRLLLWIIDRARQLENGEAWSRTRPGTFAMHMTSLHVFEGDQI